MNMMSVFQSTTDFFHSFTTALRISTHTHTRIPAKALCTAGRCAKFWINAAIIVIITSDGNTTPSVANMPPRMPACFWPTKVAVFTAITPGVHWPIAYQSMTSSSVAQRRFSTTSRCRAGSIA